MTTGYFEARKHAIRQTADGWVVSFIIHPNDITPEFATAPLGTRYMVGFAEISDDEKPVTPVQPKHTNPDAAARYASLSAPEKAVQRAGMLGDDPRFQAWVINRVGRKLNASECAAYIRHECGVRSRSEIATDPEALRAFIALETAYRSETGLLAECRG